jgi:hypothetical protein
LWQTGSQESYQNSINRAIFNIQTLQRFNSNGASQLPAAGCIPKEKTGKLTGKPVEQKTPRKPKERTRLRFCHGSIGALQGYCPASHLAYSSSILAFSFARNSSLAACPMISSRLTSLSPIMRSGCVKNYNPYAHQMGQPFGNAHGDIIWLLLFLRHGG